MLSDMNKRGFTLAELLIALLIIAEIATFTIPKVLSSQQNGKFNARAKEAAAMVSGAYQLAQLEGLVTSGTQMQSLTPYMNYVKISTSDTVDAINTVDYYSCSTTVYCQCIKLHNGATLTFFTGRSFGGTGTTNAIPFAVDPEEGYSGTTNGPGKSELFFLYYNGRISTGGSIANNTCDSSFCNNPNPTYEASWFSW